MSFVERSIILCPYLGGSPIRGSTVYIYSVFTCTYDIVKLFFLMVFYQQLLNKALLDPKQSCFLNRDVLTRFRRTGGVSNICSLGLQAFSKFLYNEKFNMEARKNENVLSFFLASQLL